MLFNDHFKLFISNSVDTFLISPLVPFSLADEKAFAPAPPSVGGRKLGRFEVKADLKSHSDYVGGIL